MHFGSDPWKASSKNSDFKSKNIPAMLFKISVPYFTCNFVNHQPMADETKLR